MSRMGPLQQWSAWSGLGFGPMTTDILSGPTWPLRVRCWQDLLKPGSSHLLLHSNPGPLVLYSPSQHGHVKSKVTVQMSGPLACLPYTRGRSQEHCLRFISWASFPFQISTTLPKLDQGLLSLQTNKRRKCFKTSLDSRFLFNLFNTLKSEVTSLTCQLCLFPPQSINQKGPSLLFLFLSGRNCSTFQEH